MTNKSFAATYHGKPIVIMGKEWTIEVVPYDDPKMKKCNADGLCEVYERTIKIRDLEQDPEREGMYDSITEFMKNVLRHEIIHAFFHETCHQKYKENEELVEILAQAVPKLSKIMENAEVLR